MLRTIRKLAGDEAGFIISAELVSVTTIVVLGMVVGLAAVRDSVTNELNDVAHAFGAVSQTYHVAGLTKNCHDCNEFAHTFGTAFQTDQVARRTKNCNNCNDITHTFGTVSQTDHVAGWTKNCYQSRVHASINGFGFNDDDDDDECDWTPIRDSDVCGKNDRIHPDND